MDIGKTPWVKSDKILGVHFFMPARKGQKFKHYTEEMKKEAIRLHVEEGWTYRRITTHLDIHDQDRVRKWMARYKKQGEYGLFDQRGVAKEQYVDKNRQLARLKRENELLKKCLHIWMREV
ncbi:helix-turn-helix domain-containing protein [Paenibacillus chitinolyticus]|uniref:helix-turn-helix domain-containing protein n=1 Tax=Paenibacillus chitinolyticus TaxID=79263 RepID=UPI00295F437E|nr:helix-turn-helix domain-containing protein [Paenibacillus chitinolyticus]